MVWSFGLLLLPENMLLTVDCITPDMVQSLFGVISLSLQYSKILLATASCNFIQAPVDYLLPKVYNFNKNKVVNVCTSCECVDNFFCVYYNCVVNTSLINKACCFGGKAAYIERYQAMIDNSKYCIFYFDYDNYANISTAKTSGTAIAYKYAKSKNKIIINLFN